MQAAEEKQIQEAQEIVQTARESISKNSNVFDSVIQELYAQERRLRLMANTLKAPVISEGIVQLYLEKGDLDGAIESTRQICKKRGQFKEAHIRCIRRLKEAVKTITDPAQQISFIEKLREFSAGKLHVEREHAELTEQLAKLYEDEGKIKEACDTLESVGGDTCGAYSPEERFHYLLEQIRMFLATNQLSKASIFANKAARGRQISGEGIIPEEMKRQFYRLRAQIFEAREEWADVAHTYWLIFNSRDPTTEEQAAAFTSAVIATALACHHSSLDPLIEQLSRLPLLSTRPSAHELAVLELLHPFSLALAKSLYSPLIISWESLTTKLENSEEPFTHHLLEGERMELLHRRMVQRNLRVLSRLVSRASLKEIGELVGVSASEARTLLCESADQYSFLRVDATTETVLFEPPSSDASLLADWTETIQRAVRSISMISNLVEVRKDTESWMKE